MESPSKVLFLYSCVVGIKKRGPKLWTYTHTADRTFKTNLYTGMYVSEHICYSICLTICTQWYIRTYTDAGKNIKTTSYARNEYIYIHSYIYRRRQKSQNDASRLLLENEKLKNENKRIKQELADTRVHLLCVNVIYVYICVCVCVCVCVCKNRETQRYM